MAFKNDFALLLLTALLSSVFGQTINNKICSKQSSRDTCEQLARDNKLACKYYMHKVDCMIDIDIGKSQVGSISAEEAFLGAGLVSDNVVVVAEIVDRHTPPQTTVVIRSNLNINSFGDLKGKRLCHPGYKHDEAFSTLMLQQLESQIVDLDKNAFCSDKSITLLEKHVSSLASFFGESCRPGPWTQDDTTDKKLKEKYGNLCSTSMCGPQKCNVAYDNPFNDALKCLKDQGGDLAVSTLRESTRFFNTSNNAQTYKYLCKDGRSSTTPCTWTNQLSRLIVADKDTVATTTAYLKAKLAGKVVSASSIAPQSTDFTEKYLTDILELKKFEKIQFLSSFKSLQQYVKEKRGDIPTASVNTKCDTTIKWCTYSDLEYQKCKWLSQAALNRAIQPVVECIRNFGDNDELSCLDAVKKSSADIVVASSDYAYISQKKSLIGLAYPETDTRNLTSVLVVKKSDDTSINNFNDLQSKKACLPRFGGQEFLAFTSRIYDIASKERDCNFGKVFSDFVSSSCVPGVRHNLVQDATENVDKDKLCSTCVAINSTRTATYCNADSINKFYGNDGAITCLNTNGGDFAVITKPNLRRDIANMTEWNNLTVLCKNGKLSGTAGLDVDEDCALVTITGSEIVAREDDAKNEDIKLALYEFETWFGKDVNKPFYIFQEFNRTKDLLFKDSTPGLDFDEKNQYINNYKKLLAGAKTCKPVGSGSQMTTASVLFIIAYFLTHLVNP